MSDSRRVYRAICQAMKQLYPNAPQGNLARHLNTLAGKVTGIVLGKSCQLPILAAKVPDDTPAESRSKRFSRWLQNEAVTPECYFLPFIEFLLTSLAQSRPLVLIMDGSEVGRGCLALVISVVYGHRALPIAWVVVRGSKDHFPADTHVRLLRAVVERMPCTATALFLGDGEFDSRDLQQALDACEWTYGYHRHVGRLRHLPLNGQRPQRWGEFRHAAYHRPIRQIDAMHLVVPLARLPVQFRHRDQVEDCPGLELLPAFPAHMYHAPSRLISSGRS